MAINKSYFVLFSRMQKKKRAKLPPSGLGANPRPGIPGPVQLPARAQPAPSTVGFAARALTTSQRVRVPGSVSAAVDAARVFSFFFFNFFFLIENERYCFDPSLSCRCSVNTL